MKYIITFLLKSILYLLIFLLVYIIFWGICILWYFKLDPQFPKREGYVYNPPNWKFSDEFQYDFLRRFKKDFGLSK